MIHNKLIKIVIDKFQYQWKTIKKAFWDLNKEKSGFIQPSELKAYLTNWGLDITAEQF